MSAHNSLAPSTMTRCSVTFVMKSNKLSNINKNSHIPVHICTSLCVAIVVNNICIRVNVRTCAVLCPAHICSATVSFCVIQTKTNLVASMTCWKPTMYDRHKLFALGSPLTGCDAECVASIEICLLEVWVQVFDIRVLCMVSMESGSW